MKIKIEFDITGCVDCPQLTTGRTFGNDGRDGQTVYKCKKGVFGGKCSYGCDTGEYTVPKIPPFGCPYIKANSIDRVASKLKISSVRLKQILNEENCVIIDDL